MANLYSCFEEGRIVLFIGSTTDDIQEKDPHTTKCPDLSRISGLTPASLPVIFSTTVVFPAFCRPIIKMRNRGHNCLILSGGTSILMKSTEQSRTGVDGQLQEKGKAKSVIGAQVVAFD